MDAGIHAQNGHGRPLAEEHGLEVGADAEALRLPGDWTSWRARKQQGRHSTADYLAGGLPLTWLARAAQLSSGAGMVAAMLWHLRNLQKARPAARHPQPTVRLEPQHYVTFGVHRHTVSRALTAMAAAGLVKVQQESGYPAEVTLLLP